MAAKIQKGHTLVGLQLIATEINRLRDAAVSTNFHASATQYLSETTDPPTVTTVSVTAANASNLATSVTLVQQIKGVYNVHVRDASAHNTALSAVNSSPDVDPSSDAATQLAAASVIANAVKTAYGTHLAAASVHFNNDATNTISAANATDQSSLNTLLNELKTDLNAHIAGALAGFHIELTDF